MSTEDLNSYVEAYGPEFKFTDENIGMHAAFAERLCNMLTSGGPKRLLSLGVGHATVARTVLEVPAEQLTRYVLLEGSEQMIEQFRQAVDLPPHMELVQTWFEEYESDEAFDVIEMGFVLEHVDDPDALVDRYKRFLRPSGALLMAVPNARSLHRLIGHQAGLLDNVYRLSEHGLALGQKRYFDHASLIALVMRNGLKIVRTEGIYLKPMTTGQLAALDLPDAVWSALYHGGVEFPEISNAILVEATI